MDEEREGKERESRDEWREVGIDGSLSRWRQTGCVRQRQGLGPAL